MWLLSYTYGGSVLVNACRLQVCRSPYVACPCFWKLRAQSHEWGNSKSSCSPQFACNSFSIILTRSCCPHAPIVHPLRAQPSSCTSPNKPEERCMREVVSDECLSMKLCQHLTFGLKTSTLAGNPGCNVGRSLVIIVFLGSLGLQHHNRATKTYCMLKLSDHG